MSLRATEEEPAAPYVAPLLPPLVAPPTGCGPSVRFDGAVIPCGIVFAHGDQTLANTYIITGRRLSSLNMSGQLVSRNRNAPASVYDVQRALAAIGNYGNVYGYGVYKQHEQFVAADCLREMGAVDYSSRMIGGGLDKAYAAVHTQCTASYGSNYTMCAFKK